MNITESQKELKSLIHKKLRELEFPERPHSLYDPVRYTLSLGGKRIRPYFALIGCGLCGGEPENALPAGMAIELLHNFTLLHDDIMDAADKRRGKDSVFKKWDASTAILSGDAMYAWAFEQLQYYGNDDSFTKRQYALIMDIFLESARNVCEGQAYDLEFEEAEMVSMQNYLKMIRGKTAALISASFKMGGAVASGNDRQLRNLQEFGTEIGTAFQIQDDLLDVIADPEKFGKKQGGDIIEGKKTYLSILSLESGNKEETKILKNVLQKPVSGKEDVDKIIDIYTSLGVIEKTKATIKHHYENALEHLEVFESSIYKDDIIDYLNKLINREY
ncbi:polyprenyl synthetase family protein [Balneolaceae bacterium YR4-1]|uniref:Polyprenyl synthetase family protein n=1 Tax=Halalkalibaculum roseum TaxID=2709311 RepID=A0A6M1SZ20_9BACT|nr:polyprenyl synthetase family protein [Halalkalibaculum roseum]